MSCESILIVEAHDDVREAIEQALQMEGYRVYAARDGREALAALRRIEGRTLVLLGAAAPSLNGKESVESQLLEEPPFVERPVVLVAALSSAGTLRAGGHGINAASCAREPLKLETLLETVRHYCGRGEDGRAMDSLSEATLGPEAPEAAEAAPRARAGLAG